MNGAMPSKTAIILLVFVVMLGGALRFWSLGSTELIHDEGLDIFRSIGYVDYLDSDSQSTPIQWLSDKPLPWWVPLSFHDDPPLFFLIQHTFIGAFGDNLFAERLPSALAGIGSIVLLFFIVRRLLRNSDNKIFSWLHLTLAEGAGVMASFILSINFAHIWISRIAILESTVLFFVLLNIYFFLRFINFENRTTTGKSESPVNWIGFGATLGLSWLTKYTSIFIIPVYAAYVFIFNRTVFKKRKLYFALVLAVVIFSPVIVYNVYLYQTFGHFDLQIATLLHQNVPYWQGESGKTQEPFSHIKENLLAMYSLPLLLLVALGIVAALVMIVSRREAKYFLHRGLIFSLALNISLTLLFIFIGSAIRFIALYSVAFAMIIAMLFASGWAFAKENDKKAIRWTLVIIFTIFFVSESVFTARTMRVVYSADFGVLAMDHYFNSLFQNMRPPGLLQHQNPHLNAVIQKYASGYSNTLPPTGIIYDDNIELPHRLWLFSRRELYHGIPIMSASMFENIIQKEGKRQFTGFTLYFVRADVGAAVRDFNQFPQAKQIENLLKKDFKLFPQATFADDEGRPAFRVYTFSFAI